MRDVRAIFPDAKRNGAGWLAKCPAHDDRRASLSIGTGDDGRVLLHCHAHCTLDEILAAAHLEHADLFPNTTTATKTTIVATYPYHDEGGAHLFDVVRFEPKDFRQRRADGVWKMAGVRRVLYRLPELQGQTTTAYVVEGEKDADRLWAIGLPGTTNAGGAGKWMDAFAQQLAHATVDHVVILPDHDEPGRQHAAHVAASCHAAGLKVKIIELPGLPLKGDVSDWLDVGHTREELLALVKATAIFAPATPTAPEPVTAAVDVTLRRIQLTPASTIQVRPVRWLWTDRLALGTLGLIGGREGTGKSIAITTIGALLTRGLLRGVYFGTPKAVIVAATEDSWEHTIVPRFMAADADLDRVFRVDVMTSDAIDSALSLPRDLAGLERVVVEVGAALIIIDPLLSRLDSALDSHKDAEVRLALEPMVALADRTGATVAGLIHVNKSANADALTSLMGSRAFAAVARSVLFVMVDPDNEKTRLLGQAKNNLGRMDLPTLAFTIVGCKVKDTAEGPVWTGKLEWAGESDRSIREALESAAETSEDKSATSEAGEWLVDFLTEQGGSADSAIVRREGAKAGHSKNALHRTKLRLGITSLTSGFPRRSFWHLSVFPTPGETLSNGNTGNTGNTVGPVFPVFPVGDGPPARANERERARL